MAARDEWAMRFWQSDLALYLLPLPSIIFAVIVAGFEYWRTEELDIPKAVALGIPIPLAVSYFLWFGQIQQGWLSVAKVFAPQAFIFIPIGIWLLIAAARGREFSILSTLTILLLGFLGHWWSMMLTGIE